MMALKFLVVAIGILLIAAGVIQLVYYLSGSGGPAQNAVNQTGDAGSVVAVDSTFEYSVGNCDESKGNLNSIDIRLGGNGDIMISQDVSYVCCAIIALDYERASNTIKIYERNKGGACKCMCGYHIEARLKGLPKGTYEIKVYGIEYKDGDTLVHYLELLGKGAITIGGGPGSKPECGGVMCALYCENGFEEDENGCPICKCKEVAGNECATDLDCAVDDGCSGQVYESEHNEAVPIVCLCIHGACKLVKDDLTMDRFDCENAGGNWGPIGLNPTPRCNMPTSDGGAECTDGGQCESGYCLAEGPSATAGKCSSYELVVGCINMVQNGRVEGTLCID